jgi:hypothetical protein
MFCVTLTPKNLMMSVRYREPMPSFKNSWQTLDELWLWEVAAGNDPLFSSFNASVLMLPIFPQLLLMAGSPVKR